MHCCSCRCYYRHYRMKSDLFFNIIIPYNEHVHNMQIEMAYLYIMCVYSEAWWVFKSIMWYTGHIIPCTLIFCSIFSVSSASPHPPGPVPGLAPELLPGSSNDKECTTLPVSKHVYWHPWSLGDHWCPGSLLKKLDEIWWNGAVKMQFEFQFQKNDPLELATLILQPI